MIMLPRKRRLNREFIKKVIKQGKAVRGRGISLKYLVVSGRPSAFSFIVSGKNVKKAVDRNKLKRRGRAIVFKLFPRLKEGVSGLIFFNQDSQNMNFSSLEKEITALFQKTNFLKENL